MTPDLKLVPLTTEQTQEIDFCKKTLMGFISTILKDADSIKSELSAEVLITIVYLKIFSAYLEKQQFESLEEAWRFMNDIRGIIDKIWYVDGFISNVKQSLEENSKKNS